MSINFTSYESDVVESVNEGTIVDPGFEIRYISVRNKDGNNELEFRLLGADGEGLSGDWIDLPPDTALDFRCQCDRIEYRPVEQNSNADFFYFLRE